MTTRKKKAPRRSNSNIAAAQRASVEERLSRQDARQAKNAGNGSSPTGGPKISAGNPPLTDPKQQAAQDSVSNRNSNTLTKSTLQQVTRPGENQPGSSDETFKAGQQAANKIAGLLSGIGTPPPPQQPKPTYNPLADASNYGGNAQARADRLTALLQAQNKTQLQNLQKSGKAVWMGYTHNRAKVRNSGPERMDENGNDTTVVHYGDDVRSTDELMSWLSDEKTFNQIKSAAQKAGIQVQSYDDVYKIWQTVVQQAADTYSTTGKKVTPWALLALRGKTMVNGKPAAKTTTSTNIQEMDPAQAKVMLKNTLADALGRDPQQSEIDDFIAKAQMIAKENPAITKTTTNYDFAGNPTDQTSTTTGGTDAVTAKAQLEAQQMAKNAPDYAEFQSAGVFMPWLNEALASPV